jgi:predicted nucleotidyltransferase
MAILQRIPVEQDVLDAFCKRWKIAKLELFGSYSRGDATPASDIDLLVTFARDAEWSLIDHVHIENELSDVLGRKVDLISRAAIEGSPNALRRRAILDSAVPIYVA